MRWLRLYDDTINDPKILKLPEATRWHWVALLCIASKNDGRLPPLDDIAIQLRVSLAKATEILAALVKASLIDKTETGFKPHNWDGRQFKSDVSTDRVKRFRNGKRNVSGTPPETDTETDTETVANASGAEAPLDPSVPEREYFSRGREVLGKNAGGQLANLLKSKGGNVALARAAIEAASQKDRPAEYIGAIVRAPIAKPLTQHQQKQNQLKDIVNDLQSFAAGGGRSDQQDLGALRHHPGQRPAAIRGGAHGDLVDISPGRRREGG